MNRTVRVPDYAPAFAVTHCDYPQRDGQAEFGRSDMAIQNFPHCEVGRRSVLDIHLYKLVML